MQICVRRAQGTPSLGGHVHLLFKILYLEIVSILQKSLRVRIEHRLRAGLLYRSRSVCLRVVSMSEPFESKLRM